MTSLWSPSRTNRTGGATKCSCWHCVWTSQGDTRWGTARPLCKPESRPEVAGLWISFFSCKGGCLNVKMFTGFKSTVFCGRKSFPIIILFYSDPLELCSDYVLFRRVEFWFDQSFLSALQKKNLPCWFCIYCMYVFIPDPTVKIELTTMRHRHHIFHIMLFFVLIRSMCRFLVKRQLGKMLLRCMRRLGGITVGRRSQQTYSFPAVRNNSLALLRTSRSNVTTASTSPDSSWG